MSETRFLWNGLSGPLQFLIRMARFSQFSHYDTDIAQELLTFILSHAYKSRHEDIITYINTAYEGPQGAHQKDKSYYEFWDEKLRPYYQAAFVIFDSCVLQKHIDKVINDFNDAHAVGS